MVQHQVSSQTVTAKGPPNQVSKSCPRVSKKPPTSLTVDFFDSIGHERPSPPIPPTGSLPLRSESGQLLRTSEMKRRAKSRPLGPVVERVALTPSAMQSFYLAFSNTRVLRVIPQSSRLGSVRQVDVT